MAWGPNPVTGAQNLSTSSTGYISSLNTDNSGLSVSDGCDENGGVIEKPDLIVINQTASPSTVNPGAYISLSSSLKNNSAYAAGSSYMRYYISNDANFDVTDIYLGYDYVGALAPGASSYETFGFTLPSVGSGYKYIFFVADATNAVDELDETNNAVYDRIYVRIIIKDDPKEVPIETQQLRLVDTPQIETMTFPNPFDYQTTIQYTLTEATTVSLSVFDMQGREVAQLIKEETQIDGTHRAVFNANSLPNGTYMYRLQTGTNVTTGRMMLVK